MSRTVLRKVQRRVVKESFINSLITQKKEVGKFVKENEFDNNQN